MHNILPRKHAIITMMHNSVIFSPVASHYFRARRITAAVVTAAGALALSGCSMFSVGSSSNFSCPGMPGVMCQTPQQVYAQTSGSSMPPNVFQAGTAATSAAPGQGLAPVLPVPGPAMLQPVTGAPMPLREPARVIRIWIAPWIEKKTDHLHWPTYIFAEVQPRKWTVGKPEFASMRAGMPLFVKPSVAQVPMGAQPPVTPAQASMTAPGVAGSGASAPERQTQPVLVPSGAGQDNFQQPF